MSESSLTRKIGRRDFLKVVTAVSAGAFLAACSPQAAPTAAPTAGDTTAPASKDVVKIRVTHEMNVANGESYAATVKDDLAAKNIEMEIFQTPMDNWSQYADKLITQIAGGEQLDVLMIAIEGIALLGVKDILADLTTFMAAAPDIQKMVTDDIAPSLTDMLKYKGKLLEIPFSWNNMVMFYNTKIIKEKGITMPMHQTWDDFVGWAQEVANVKGEATDRYAYNFWSSGTFGWLSWLYMNDGQGFLTDDWTDSNLNNPKVAETIQFMADLVLKYKVAPNPAGWDEGGQFLAGNVVSRTCGHWCIQGLLENNFTDYDLVYQPHKSGNITTVAGTDGWGVTSKTKYPDQAFQVAAALSGPKPSLEMVKMGGNIPALRSISEKPEFATYGPANTKIFYESLDGAKSLQAPVNFNIIEPVLDRNFASIWTGEVSVEAGLAQAHKELQAEMDKIK
jgi:multiple sugar transport system substrate-binding protein